MDEQPLFDESSPPCCLDYKRTVIAQYSNSPVLMNFIYYFSGAMQTCVFFNEFYEKIWDLDTATGMGLDIWGQIVGVNRTVKTFTGFFWGFNEETLFLARPYHDITGFNDRLNENADRREVLGMFRDFQELEGEVTFENDSFRKLILAKAHANISDYTVSDLNRILMFLFAGQGHEIYVRDNFDMSMTIVFNWLPNSDEVAIIKNAGLLFRPAGVQLKVDIHLNR